MREGQHYSIDKSGIIKAGSKDRAETLKGKFLGYTKDRLRCLSGPVWGSQWKRRNEKKNPGKFEVPHTYNHEVTPAASTNPLQGSGTDLEHPRGGTKLELDWC
jgi:hypothetical protein